MFRSPIGMRPDKFVQLESAYGMPFPQQNKCSGCFQDGKERVLLHSRTAFILSTIAVDWLYRETLREHKLRKILK